MFWALSNNLSPYDMMGSIYDLLKRIKKNKKCTMLQILNMQNTTPVFQKNEERIDSSKGTVTDMSHHHIDFYPPKDNRYGPIPPRSVSYATAASVPSNNITMTSSPSMTTYGFVDRLQEHPNMVCHGPKPNLSSCR